MTGYFQGTRETPKIIRYLIWITSIVTLISAGAEQLFSQLLHSRGPVDFLGLSWFGVRHYLFWQPVTYMFVQEISSQGITLLFLITLFLNMYVLWLLGSMILEQIGSTRFLVLYLGSGILAGLTALFLMPAFGIFSTITGPAAALLALGTVWTMYFSDSVLTFLFLFPIQAKWLLAGVLGALALLCLSQWDPISFIFYFSGALYGYLFAVMVLKLQSPYTFMHRFDRIANRFGNWITNKFSRKKQGAEDSSKVVDFKTGAPKMDDDAFVDAMLTKIIKYGENSLTNLERRRMEEISARKAKKNPNDNDIT